MRALKNVICIIVLLFSLQLKAQDFPYHYFTHIDPMLNNPSLAGLNHKINVNAATYNLWAGGFKPLNDYLLSFSISPDFIKNRRGIFTEPRYALGAVLQRENMGPFTLNILQLIYAYHIPLSNTALLSLGVNGLIENIGIDVNSLTPIQNDDPRLLTGNNNAFAFDGGFGATVSSKYFRVSLSILNLAPATFRFNDGSSEEIPEYRKYFLTGNYQVKLSDKFFFQPEIVLRNTILNNLGYDFSASFDLYFLSFGLGYRSENTIFIYVKVPMQDFVFLYTSENPVNANHMIGNGHTFSVGWSFE
jgi:type IX secretion system PorP/SprF family membrane protein